MPATEQPDDKFVDMFVNFLRFKTISFEGHKTGENVACVNYLKSLLDDIGLSTVVLEGPSSGCKPGEKPILIGEWPGLDKTLPSVLLNSHYDVVPVLEEHWKQPAWDGLIVTQDAEERIYGRGSQDMKCVCIQYIAAISRLRANGFQPMRTIYLTFVPDEEVGGHGMRNLLESSRFAAMRIGVALDEGLANPSPDKFTVFYGERTPWWVLVEAKGPTGHGSRFIDGTATNAISAFTNSAWKYRKEQKSRLGLTNNGCAHCEALKLGDVTTVNLTMLRAGVSSDNGSTFALNVIPTEAKAGFDIRIPITLPHADLRRLLDQWCHEAEQEVGAKSGSVSWSNAPWLGSVMETHHITPTDESNPWWGIFSEAIHSLDFDGVQVSIEKEVFPAATDSRFLRAMGIPCFGFSPMRNCPILLHEHDEYLPKRTFVEGIRIYEQVIQALSCSRSDSCKGEVDGKLRKLS